jgi:hypothetical protein
MNISTRIRARSALIAAALVGAIASFVPGAGLLAQPGPVPGQPASIVLRYVDPDTGQYVNISGSRFVQPNSRLRLVAEVYDGYGQRADLARFPCTVNYEVWNNYAGSRQSGVLNGGFVETTPQMGPFQVGASCQENPAVRASPDQLTVSTSQLAPAYGQQSLRMAQAQAQAASLAQSPSVQTPAATGGKSASGGGLSPAALAGVIGGGVLAAGAIAAAASAASTTDGGTCFLRICLRSSLSGTCSCQSFDQSDICALPVTSVGGQCVSGNTTVARCPSGTSCTNGTCNTQC